MQFNLKKTLNVNGKYVLTGNGMPCLLLNYLGTTIYTLKRKTKCIKILSHKKNANTRNFLCQLSKVVVVVTNVNKNFFK